MATVLVIDDDESVARLVADIVSFCKHTPIVLTQPFQAVTQLHTRRIDAILSDYMMPQLNGVELLMIAEETSPTTRRILITAAPQEHEVREALRTGVAQMVLAKPPRLDQVQLALAWL